MVELLGEGGGAGGGCGGAGGWRWWSKGWKWWGVGGGIEVVKLGRGGRQRW